MTSFYSRTPSEFMIEYGWGGRSIDPEDWQAQERRSGPSLWGHERVYWTSDEAEESGRANCQAEERRQRTARAGTGDGRKLSGHAWRLSVVGRRRELLRHRRKSGQDLCNASRPVERRVDSIDPDEDLMRASKNAEANAENLSDPIRIRFIGLGNGRRRHGSGRSRRIPISSSAGAADPQPGNSQRPLPSDHDYAR